MGNWNTTFLGGGATPDAPNVLNTGAHPTTVTTLYDCPYNASVYKLSIAISLDITNPNIQHLCQLHIVDSLTQRDVALLVKPAAGWTNQSVIIDTDWSPQANSARNGNLAFRCINDDNKLTAGEVTVGYSVQPSLVVGFGSVTETGTRHVLTDGTRLVHLTLSMVPSFYNNQVPQVATYLVSSDNGANFTWIGWRKITAVGQAIDVDRLVPGSAGQWKVAALAGAWGWDAAVPIAAANLPFGTSVSGTINVAGIATPGANNGILATIGTCANVRRNDGTQYGRISTEIYTDPPAGNTNFFVRITVQDLVNGVPNGPEKPHGGTQIMHGTHVEAGLDITYVAGMTGIRYKFYVANLNSQGAGDFADATTNTLQNVSYNGGAAASYYDVAVTVPAGALDARQLDPTTLGNFLTRTADGTPGVASGNLGSSLIADWNFEFTPAGNADAVVSKWGHYTPAGASVEFRNDGGYSGSNYVRLTNAQAQISQYTTITPGQALYFGCAVRSNNTLPSGYQQICIAVTFYSEFNGSLTPLLVNGNYTNYFQNTGYFPAWTQGAGGILQAPANAAKVLTQYVLNVGDNPGSYWDVDACVVQDVTNQSNNGQARSDIPSSNPSWTTSLITGKGPTYGAGYGTQFMSLATMTGTPIGFDVTLTTDYVKLQLTAGGHQFFIALSATSGLSIYADGTYGLASGAIAGHSAKAGIVI